MGRALRGVRVEDEKRGRKFGRTNVVAALCGKAVLAPYHARAYPLYFIIFHRTAFF
jgi:hypothetical protein